MGVTVLGTVGFTGRLVPVVYDCVLVPLGDLLTVVVVVVPSGFSVVVVVVVVCRASSSSAFLFASATAALLKYSIFTFNGITSVRPAVRRLTSPLY